MKRKLLWLIVAGALVWSVACCGRAQAEQEGKEEESLFVAQKAFDDGFYDVTLQLLDRFQKNYPVSSKLPEVKLLVGQCYFHQNKFLEALNTFDALRVQPSSGHIKDAALYWTAEVHFRGNNFSKAASYYKMIIDDFPDSTYRASAYYSLGWCMFQEQKFKEALEYFTIVEVQFPKQAQVQEAAFKILECLYNLKDYTALKERAQSYLIAYAKDTAKTPYLAFYVAEADYYLDNFKDAVTGYTKVLAGGLEPKVHALARLGMGWSYLKLKDYDKARAAFEQIEPTALASQSRDALYLGKAVLASETNEFQQAALLYDDLLVASSEPLVILQAYLGKAEAMYNLNNYKDAIQAYREAARKVAPESLPREMIDKLHYGLAWAYVKEGQFKEAIAEFRKIVKNTQDQVFKISALCQIGDAYQDSGDYQKALATYEGILREYPDSLYSDYVQYQLGLVLLKLQNYDAAILSFSNLRTNFPDSKLLDDATYALGMAYFQKQDYNSSREIFEGFEKGFPESSFKSQALYLLGTSLYNLGRYADAIEAFKNIIRLYGQDTDLVQKAEYEIADSFYQMGNEKEAMNRFTALRAKYPDSSLTAEIMWWLGGYYYRQNDLALALRYFSSLIQDFPNSPVIPDAYYALGSVYAEEAKFDEAIGNFRKVIELTTSDLAAQAAIAIADLYVRQRKYDEALELYREKATQYPNLTHLIYPKIGDTLVRTQKTDEALEFYRKALAVVPLGEKADMHFKVAETLQAKGKLKDAVEEYLNVTYLFPEDKELAVKSYLRVAQIFEDQENVQEAMRIYEKVAGFDVPEAKAARQKLENLQAGARPSIKKK